MVIWRGRQRHREAKNNAQGTAHPLPEVVLCGATGHSAEGGGGRSLEPGRRRRRHPQVTDALPWRRGRRRVWCPFPMRVAGSEPRGSHRRDATRALSSGQRTPTDAGRESEPSRDIVLATGGGLSAAAAAAGGGGATGEWRGETRRRVACPSPTVVATRARRTRKRGGTSQWPSQTVNAGSYGCLAGAKRKDKRRTLVVRRLCWRDLDGRNGIERVRGFMFKRWVRHLHQNKRLADECCDHPPRGWGGKGLTFACY